MLHLSVVEAVEIVVVGEAGGQEVVVGDVEEEVEEVITLIETAE